MDHGIGAWPSLARVRAWQKSYASPIGHRLCQQMNLPSQHRVIVRKPEIIGIGACKIRCIQEPRQPVFTECIGDHRPVAQAGRGKLRQSENIHIEWADHALRCFAHQQTGSAAPTPPPTPASAYHSRLYCRCSYVQRLHQPPHRRVGEMGPIFPNDPLRACYRRNANRFRIRVYALRNKLWMRHRPYLESHFV